MVGADRLGRSRLGLWPFAAVAVCSFGGPLALAALAVPAGIADAPSSAGLAVVAATALFVPALVIWLRYAREVAGPGGLYSFVEAAAGRRLALAQAGLWALSYLLYVVYTTVQIVYDVLPAVIPGERRQQTLLALLIPVALVAVMIAGRAATLAVLAAVAVGQLALAGILDGVTVAHLATPASSFGAGGEAGTVAKASAQTSLLYVCGSLPLFLGGEVRAPARTIRRGLVGVFAVCEYLAMTRLLHAAGGWPVPVITVALGLIFLAAAPLVLIDPEGIYTALLRPSLIALWLSQLVVFAVYPRFARRTGRRTTPAWTLSLIAGGLAAYGLWLAISQAGS